MITLPSKSFVQNALSDWFFDSLSIRLLIEDASEEFANRVFDSQADLDTEAFYWFNSWYEENKDQSDEVFEWNFMNMLGRFVRGLTHASLR
jgi:uroporphyrinogen-III decarboxylase